MTPEERKRRSESILAERAIPVHPGLPAIESEEDTSLRSSVDVARRVLCIMAVADATRGSRKEIRGQLKESGFWAHLSPAEREFMSSWRTKKELLPRMSWSLEGAVFLAWTLQLFEELTWAGSTFHGELGELVVTRHDSFFDFVECAELRSTSEILDATDLAYRQHWGCTDARLKGEALPSLNPVVVYERYRAANWLICYDPDATWDETPTGT